MTTALDSNDAVMPPLAAVPGTAGRILMAATRRFAREGFAGTSIRAIATDVDINSATLYSHFASKTEVLEALVKTGHEELAANLRDALARVQDAGADEKLRAVVEADVRVHTTYPLLATVINTELHSLDPAAAAEAHAVRASLVSDVAAVVREGIDAGIFTVSDPELAIRAVSDMIKSVPHWFDPTTHDADTLAKRYGDFALQLMGATTPPTTNTTE